MRFHPEVPPHLERLAKRGLKTKYTHPAQYQAYLHSRSHEIAALAGIVDEPDLDAAYEDGVDLVDIYKMVAGSRLPRQD